MDQRRPSAVSCCLRWLSRWKAGKGSFVAGDMHGRHMHADRSVHTVCHRIELTTMAPPIGRRSRRSLARYPRRFKPRHRARVVFAEQSRAQQGSHCRCRLVVSRGISELVGARIKGTRCVDVSSKAGVGARGERRERGARACMAPLEGRGTYEMDDDDVCLFAVRVRTYVAVMASRSDGAIPVHVCHICEWLRPVGCSSW